MQPILQCVVSSVQFVLSSVQFAGHMACDKQCAVCNAVLHFIHSSSVVLFIWQGYIDDG